MPTQYGNIDTRLSDARKCWLTDDSTATICGVYGPGTTVSVHANWEQPFTGMTPGKIREGLAALGQQVTGATLLTAQNTRQTWTNNEPTAINLELLLYALQDPVAEVMMPLQILEQFISPDAASFIGKGNIAKSLALDIGRRIIYDHLVFKSLSVPFDKEVDSQGNLVRATVTLELSTITMVTKDMLKQGFGLGAKIR